MCLWYSKQCIAVCTQCPDSAEGGAGGGGGGRQGTWRRPDDGMILSYIGVLQSRPKPGRSD